MAGINEPIIKRYAKNPILTKYDVPYSVETVHNAGVAKYNSKYIMLSSSVVISFITPLCYINFTIRILLNKD